jgi:hypothetical protein
MSDGSKKTTSVSTGVGEVREAETGVIGAPVRANGA